MPRITIFIVGESMQVEYDDTAKTEKASVLVKPDVLLAKKPYLAMRFVPSFIGKTIQ